MSELAVAGGRIVTPDGIVREMNHRWVEFTGLPADQLIGRQAP